MKNEKKNEKKKRKKKKKKSKQNKKLGSYPRKESWFMYGHSIVGMEIRNQTKCSSRGVVSNRRDYLLLL